MPTSKNDAYGRTYKRKVYPKNSVGKRFPTKTHVAPLRNKNGEIVAGLEVFRDISVEEEHRIVVEKFNKLIKQNVSNATIEEVVKELHSEISEKSEYKERSILFMDVVGFSSYSESHTPKVVTSMLNDLFGICEVITTEFHGDIDKFVGDCIMAVFIDATDAANAGAKILDVLTHHNGIRKKEELSEISIRIGINTGEVLQGEIGTPSRKDLTVIGDTVNTASRIESNTPPNSLCISDSTYHRVKDKSPFKKHGDIQVKNKKNPITTYILQQQ